MLSYNSLTYVQDMKIGHYSKFPLNSDRDTRRTCRLLLLSPDTGHTQMLARSTYSQHRAPSPSFSIANIWF